MFIQCRPIADAEQSDVGNVRENERERGTAHTNSVLWTNEHGWKLPLPICILK